MNLTIKPVTRNLKEYAKIKELILKSFPKMNNIHYGY